MGHHIPAGTKRARQLMAFNGSNNCEHSYLLTKDQVEFNAVVTARREAKFAAKLAAKKLTKLKETRVKTKLAKRANTGANCG